MMENGSMEKEVVKEHTFMLMAIPTSVHGEKVM